VKKILVSTILLMLFSPSLSDYRGQLEVCHEEPQASGWPDRS